MPTDFKGRTLLEQVKLVQRASRLSASLKIEEQEEEDQDEETSQQLTGKPSFVTSSIIAQEPRKSPDSRSRPA
jgi:hypothetical protein